MKKINLKYLWVMCTVLLCVSCYKKDGPLSPSNNPEDLFSLPQGDHDYDEVIMGWYEKYGFTALYIFEDKDIYWSNETWLEGDNDLSLDNNVSGGSEMGQPGDQEYVGDLCDMFDQMFLSNYPDSLLVKGMPYRVFLCSELWMTSRNSLYDDNWNFLGWAYTYDRIWMYEGWDNIAVNGASVYIRDTMDRQGQLDFSSDLNGYFLQKLAAKELIDAPDEFYAESEYDSKKSFYGLELFENGYLKNEASSVRQIKADYMLADLQAYLKLISYPLDYLENGELEEIGSDSEPSLSGIFKRPEATKVKKKYDILLQVLKDLEIKVENIQTPPVVEY